MVDLLVARKTTSPLRLELDWWRTAAKAPRLRPMGEWAESEIILPDGPYAGRRYRIDRLPWARCWFEGLTGLGPAHRGETRDSGKNRREPAARSGGKCRRQVPAGYQRFVLTGPSQSGKSLHGHVMPGLYHLFEVGETVGLGLPDLSMANDKWFQDFFPAIESSRYREWLPIRGAGSRQGRVHDAIRFGNGTTLRFFTGGGGDKARAGYTTRVMVITEVDGLDKSGQTSMEADKVRQLEARTLAYGDRRRIFLECTVSVQAGRIWQEKLAGTDSAILVRCVQCGEWVAPEREHLVGWQTAQTEAAARSASAFGCPSCGVVWTEPQRAEMNSGCRLEHRNTETDTFSMRYSAFHNLFLSPGEVGRQEWRKRHAPAEREDGAEKELRQFFWCIPVEPDASPTVSLDVEAICRRVTHDPRGHVPADARWLTVFVDIGKWLCHWMAVAIRADGSPHMVEADRIEVPTQSLGEERGILTALRQFRDRICEPGWPGPHLGGSGLGGTTPPGGGVTGQVGPVRPDVVLIDARYQGLKEDSFPVYDFIAESAGLLRRPGEPRYVASMGFGAGTFVGEYKAPSQASVGVAKIGERYHVARVVKAGRRVRLLQFDADSWKSYAHNRLSVAVGEPGAMTLHAAGPNEHLGLAKHLTAERQVEEFVAGKGLMVKWERLRKNNHWLDCLAGACCAGHLVGARLTVPGVSGGNADPRQTVSSWFAEQQKR